MAICELKKVANYGHLLVLHGGAAAQPLALVLCTANWWTPSFGIVLDGPWSNLCPDQCPSHDSQTTSLALVAISFYCHLFFQPNWCCCWNDISKTFSLIGRVATHDWPPDFPVSGALIINWLVDRGKRRTRHSSDGMLDEALPWRRAEAF